MRVTDNLTHRFSPLLASSPLATCDSACCDDESCCGGADGDKEACC